MREKGKEEAEKGKIKTALAVSTHRPIQQTEPPPLPPRMDGQLLVTHREEEEGKERGEEGGKRGMEKERNDQASNERGEHLLDQMGTLNGGKLSQLDGRE